MSVDLKRARELGAAWIEGKPIEEDLSLWISSLCNEVERLRKENEPSQYELEIARDNGRMRSQIHHKWKPLLAAIIAIYGRESCSRVREPDENCESPCELCDLENAIAAACEEEK